MKEAFELIKERLEEKKKQAHDIHGQQNINDCLLGWESAMAVALYIVSEVEAEYGNGWIPCNRADHPYDGQRVLACINTRIATHEIIITDYNGEIYWFDGTISAWMPLPEAYKPGEGE